MGAAKTYAAAKICAYSALLALAIGSTGCGTPGAPQPPSLNLPDRVTDLAAVRAGNQVTLTWTMPKRNTDKVMLKFDPTVRICRGDSVSSCSTAADQPFAPAAHATFTDTLPTAMAAGTPRPLHYFVELKNHAGRSAGMSNGALVLAGQAPAPVLGLAAEITKPGVVLRWTKGDSADAIRMERTLLSPAAAKPHAGPLAPAPEPVEQNLLIASDGGEALDKSITFGEEYGYRAQRVARVTVDGQPLELGGDLSPQVRIEARDVFPPAIPTGLVAVATVGEGAAASGTAASIDLNWQANTEPDLAGYEVYRREDESPWRRISGERPVSAPAFHDPNVLPGHTYIYSVSAVDLGGHESTRSAAAQETVPSP